MRIAFFWVTYLILSLSNTKAQSITADSALLYKGLSNYAVDIYTKTIGEQAEIYNGPQYIFLPRATKGSPYWEGAAAYQPSIIKYNGTWYKNIPLIYDSYQDVVIATHPANKIKYILHSQWLSDFVLYDHHFVHIGSVDSARQGIKPGYYDQLYAGETAVFIKRSKSKTQSTSLQGAELVYEDKEDYFIRKNDIYYRVSSKGSVLDVLKDKKKQLNNYLSSNKIDFKNDKGAAMAKVAAYYDQISR
jgi:hypothetical protein